MNTKTIASIILGLAILITLSTSVYITNEAQQVIITQFGRPVGEVVTEAGLHVKIPFIQAANYFEKRFLDPFQFKSSSLSNEPGCTRKNGLAVG